MAEAQLGVDLLQFAGAVSVVFIAVLGATIKSMKGGYLGNVLDEHAQGSNQVNGKLDDIKELSQDTYEATEQNGEQIQDLGEAIYELHKTDENVNAENLREKVGVEDDVDIFTKESYSRQDD